MDMAEPCVWGAECSEGCTDMFVHLWFLAGYARTCSGKWYHASYLAQKNLAEINLTVALGPGCANWCRVPKTTLRWVIGTRGRGASIEVSQIICVSAVGTGRYANLQVANSGDDRFKVSRRGWSKAICRKSISEGEKRELIGRRDNAAAFCSPEICRISFVNCETKSKWRVSRGEYLSGLERSAKVSGRWSV